MGDRDGRGVREQGMNAAIACLFGRVLGRVEDETTEARTPDPLEQP